jgi:5-methylcytosine-specific restriction endonuclease McrA
MPGCPSTDLTVDHVVPLVEAPQLAHDELNCRVLCRQHNAERGTQCTDDERIAVYAAINARTERRARAYQHNG